MRNVLAIGLTIGLVGAAWAAPDGADTGPTPWEDVEPISLWNAVNRGLASASGKDPASYRQVDLTVQSMADRRVVVDYGGSHLRPKRRGSCQRLGLGPPVVAALDEDGDALGATLQLEPGQTTTLRVNTVCLDANRSGPGTQSFVAVPETLPAVRRKVLAWWVENPLAPQSSVNSAIWRNAPKVRVHDWNGSAGRRETVRSAAVHGGIYYQLKNHELTSLDPDGVRRILGTEIRQVFPTDQAVYATMPGDDGEMDLWRMAPTGDDPWGFVTDLDPGWELLDLVPAGRGNLVLVTDSGVRFFRAQSRTQNRTQNRTMQNVLPLESIKSLSTRVGAKTGRIYVTTHTPGKPGVARGGEIEGQTSETFELWRIDPKTRKRDKRGSFWNVSQVAGGPAAIFGLSPVGQLRRLRDGKFRDLSSTRTYAKILQVGTQRVWVLDKENVLVAVDPRTGKRLFTSDAKVTKETHLDWDPVTDDLAYTSRSKFIRVRAADGKTEIIPED